MGVNNKQRRAAKQRKRAAQRSGGRPRASQAKAGGSTSDDAATSYARAQSLVSEFVQVRLGQALDDADLLLHAGAMAKVIAPASEKVLGEIVLGSLVDVVQAVLKGGWSLAELEEVVRRKHETWLPVLGAAATQLVGLEPEDVKVLLLGAHDRSEFVDLVVMAEGLGLLTLLCDLPLLDAEAVSRSRARRDKRPVHPKWQQVRALLSKAESTDFGPEAEALVAKAQELITKYALERLVAAAEDHDDSQAEPSTRRIWLDKPYLNAKAALIGEVARANRCRSAFAERYEFSIVVGDEPDLDAVELLATSLLLQADTAMFMHGRNSARTRSRAFRQSFLMAYATRIGERLQAADETVAANTPGALPVLHDHESRVAGVFEAMVPTQRGRSVRVTDHAGWVAGTTAADLANLDVRDQLRASGR